MARIVVPEAEAILDKEFSVLDRGFVRLVDYLGGDARIVAAARVSYGPGTKTVREDRALIDYLMRNLHTSPFEQVIMTFHVKLPIFVARQWVRHRTARLNEISARYTVMPEEFYLPESGTIRRQSSRSKQDRAEEEIPAERQAAILQILKRDQATAYASYQDMLNDDVARELARINLPLSLYTQWYWQIDLHNLFHFLRLRMDPHAQLEIREYAKVIGEMARAVAPVAYAAFEEHVLLGVQLSRSTANIVREMLEPLAAESPAAAKVIKNLKEQC
jgi:thymidylate synthase (FAD)